MSRESLLLKPNPSQESLASSPSSSALGKKGMPTHKLEITAISAEGLLDGKKPVKKNAFVSLEIDCDGGTVGTRVDEVGGDYPVWEDKLEMELSLPSSSEKKERFMYVRVCCQVSGGGIEKHVGTARVPLKDFMGGYAPEGFLHCLSYRLWDGYGKRNGVVNFSARVVPDNKAGTRSFWLR